MKGNLSTYSRERIFDEMGAKCWDVVIIGGGITGSGILLDAVSRGMSAALIEMQDFAAGTSSRSTKLVHGGLRYLKQWEVSLVAEVGRERAIVYENGPHVTRPEWMLLPIFKGGSYNRLGTSLGLFVYDRLAGVRHKERRRMLSRDEALSLEPLLRRDGLRGAGHYVEYRTDDARLTIEVLKEAVTRGALAINYVRADRFLYESGRIAGVYASDLLTKEAVEIRGKTVINATGPWVDVLREQDGSKTGKTLHHTKGVHIVVDGSRLPIRHPVYFDVPDGRMVFAIPRDGKTYIGTTDTDYHDDLVNPQMTKSDLHYLVDAANFIFPTAKLTAGDVESSWAGIRPLVHEEGKGASEISRKDEVFESPSGLITIAGGKLTGYRKMAEKVTDRIAARLRSESGTVYPPCTTGKIAISGGDFGGSEQFVPYIEEMEKKGIALGLSAEAAKRIVARYGTNSPKLFAIMQKRAEECSRRALPKDLFAELVYGIEEELVATPEDFFVRRTGAMLFDIGLVERWREPIVAYMAQTLQWSEDDHRKFDQQLRQRLLESKTALDVYLLPN